MCWHANTWMRWVSGCWRWGPFANTAAAGCRMAPGGGVSIWRLGVQASCVDTFPLVFPEVRVGTKSRPVGRHTPCSVRTHDKVMLSGALVASCCLLLRPGDYRCSQCDRGQPAAHLQHLAGGARQPNRNVWRRQRGRNQVGEGGRGISAGELSWQAWLAHADAV